MVCIINFCLFHNVIENSSAVDVSICACMWERVKMSAVDVSKCAWKWERVKSMIMNESVLHRNISSLSNTDDLWCNNVGEAEIDQNDIWHFHSRMLLKYYCKKDNLLKLSNVSFSRTVFNYNFVLLATLIPSDQENETMKHNCSMPILWSYFSFSSSLVFWMFLYFPMYIFSNLLCR